jgi:DNA-directed RNA polymerase specialized sigma24 family protein
MGSSKRFPLWWDREIDDETGKPLRADVRESAQRVWIHICRKAREVLGDSNDAAEVLERSVKAISRYLDKSDAPLHSADPGGLLVLSCYRSFRRLARSTNHIVPIGGSGEISEILRSPDWRDEIDRRLFLEGLARHLEPRSRGILRLRISGYDWKEIARMLGGKSSTVRQGFWRDVRKAHLRLLRTGDATKSEEW